MGAIVSQITSLMIVYSTVYSGVDLRRHQSSAWLAFVWGIQRWAVNSPHKGPVTRKMFLFDAVIMLMHVLWGIFRKYTQYTSIRIAIKLITIMEAISMTQYPRTRPFDCTKWQGMPLTAIFVNLIAIQD